MSSAHDFQRDGCHIYRFLCSLQRQAVCWRLKWRWGSLADADFLPRVELGRIVLSPASWRVSDSAIKTFEGASGPRRFAAVRTWQRTQKIPRLAMLVDGDERLLYDFANPMCVQMFVRQIRTMDAPRVEEVFPSVDEMPLKGRDGTYVHDVVIPFRNTGSRSRVRLNRKPVVPRVVPQRVPRSDWLYVKVYSGPAAADRLLQVFLAPLLEQMEPDLVDSWHFVRYADPDPHLRVRFHGDRNFLHADLIRKLRSELGVLRDAGIVWRSVTDTYDREVERYGGVDAMQIAEQLFAADSVAALNIATAYRGDAGADSRWLLALRGIDTLLRDFGRSPEARGDVISGLRRSFAKEFHADAGELKHQLGQRYRARRSQIERLIDSPRPVDRRLEQGFETLAERSQRIRPLAKQLSELEGMTRPVDDVLQSFIHMQCNRMLRWPSRAEEMVIYDFLGRYYESVLARQRAD